MKLYLLEYY